jgi:hypothetical protein
MWEDSPYDRSSRIIAEKAGKRMLCWMTETPLAHVGAVNALKTKLSVPGLPERESDLIWRASREDQGGLPWAVLVEFQTIPSGLMFGRLMVYGGLLWLQEKPAALPGDRFALASVVVNLTGKGDSGRLYNWSEGRSMGVQPFEWNIAGLKAEEVLGQVERDEAPLELLAWMPLMQRGGDPDIIQGWLRLAEAEKDAERRGLLKTVLVFAELAGCLPQWEKAMDGFNVMRSVVVERWKAEGEAKGKIETIREVLEGRHGPLPADLLAALTATTDLDKLRRWAAIAGSTDTLEKFRKEAGI